MIIFLDIDGVIVPIGPMASFGELRKVILKPDEHFDSFVQAHSPEAVQHVKRLCQELGAKLVIHSNWRRIFPDAFTRDFLARIGLEKHLHEDWRCQTNISADKPRDIFSWRQDHPEELACIVVDDQDLYVEQWRRFGGPPVRQIIPASAVAGLTQEDILPYLPQLSDELEIQHGADEEDNIGRQG